MTIKIFSSLPQSAVKIRKSVFIDEQGFVAEFDDKDDVAVHMVVFAESGLPIATCRIYKECDKGCYVIGRVAVIKEFRGKNIGSVMLGEAERYIKQNGGECIVLHAQQQIADFYKKSGFMEFGAVEYDEGRPHVRMKKYI